MLRAVSEPRYATSAISGSWAARPLPTSRTSPSTGSALGEASHQPTDRHGSLGRIRPVSLPQPEVQPAGVKEAQEEVRAEAVVDGRGRVRAVPHRRGGVTDMVAGPRAGHVLQPRPTDLGVDPRPSSPHGFTSATIVSSSGRVQFPQREAVGHMSPSSRFAVVEAEHRVPRLELLCALEEAHDLAVLGVRRHPVPGLRRELWRRVVTSAWIRSARTRSAPASRRSSPARRLPRPPCPGASRACVRLQFLGALFIAAAPRR